MLFRSISTCSSSPGKGTIKKEHIPECSGDIEKLPEDINALQKSNLIVRNGVADPMTYFHSSKDKIQISSQTVDKSQQSLKQSLRGNKSQYSLLMKTISERNQQKSSISPPKCKGDFNDGSIRSIESTFEISESFKASNPVFFKSTKINMPTTRVPDLEDGNQQMQIQGLIECPVDSPEEMLKFMDQGNNTRTTHSTTSNDTSSRSHASCQINVRAADKSIIGKLSLVDLDVCLYIIIGFRTRSRLSK